MQLTPSTHRMLFEKINIWCTRRGSLFCCAASCTVPWLWQEHSMWGGGGRQLGCKPPKWVVGVLHISESYFFMVSLCGQPRPVKIKTGQ